MVRPDSGPPGTARAPPTASRGDGLAEMLRELGFRSACRRARSSLHGRAVGRRARGSTRAGPEPFPLGVEDRLGDFARPGRPGARQRRDARGAGRLARAARRGQRRRAPRRLERNLHDGAQQRLVFGAARRSRSQPHRRPGGARARPAPGWRSRGARAEGSTHALSGPARAGARPAPRPSLRARAGRGAPPRLSGRAPVPGRASTSEIDERPEREQVEAAAYFVVSEALTNVAKYARARRRERPP